MFDNCEHILGSAAELIEVLAEQCPALHFLSTSHEPLEVAGEALLRLGPLDVPADASEVLTAAGVLFAQRVARARSGRPLDDDELEAAAEICQRLDGTPLALELTAARARSMPLGVIASRLEERFALLVGGPRSALARQRTLEASVAWSYDLLDADEQAALRHLAVCSGPFDLVAAEAVVAVDGTAAVDLVAALVDKSLLLDESVGGVARYRMLEDPLGYHAGIGVCRSPDRGGVPQASPRLDPRRGRRATRTVRVLGCGGGGVAHRPTIIDEVHAAMEWALSSGSSDDVLRIASSLGWYWVWHGLSGEAIGWFDRAESIADEPTGDVHLAAAVGFARPATLWRAANPNVRRSNMLPGQGSPLPPRRPTSAPKTPVPAPARDTSQLPRSRRPPP